MYKWENFDKALDWIYSFTNLERDYDKRNEKNFFQLLPISKLNEYFGNPTQNYKVIHVAGSKGKGTVSYILSRYFNQMGFNVGLYISPHIINVRERIQFNNNMIEEDDFLYFLGEIYDYVGKISDKNEVPTFFDIFTMVAFLYFSYKKVDIAIVEVGLGGRLDSTNIVNPILSVITSITLEHTEVLGKTHEKIAKEKAGIIKPNIPIVLGKNKKNVKEVVLKIAQKNKSEFYYSEDFFDVKILKYKRVEDSIYCRYKILNKEENTVNLVDSKLAGNYQCENIETSALTCLVASKILNIKYDSNLFNDIIEQAFIHSRFEVKTYSGKIVIIDGAHTENSIIKLIKTIKRLLKQNIIYPEIAIIIGMMKDKDHRGILSKLVEISSVFYFVELDKWKDSKVSNYIEIFNSLIKETSDKDKIFDDKITNQSNEIKANKDKVKFYIKNGCDWNGKEILEIIIKENPKINTIIVTGSLYLAQYFSDL